MYILFILFLVFLSTPLFISISFFVWFTSGFPIFFCQKRTGKDGIPFVMFKFRTMSPDAEKKQKIYKNKNEADGPVFKIHNDPRFTRMGKFLSHTGFDELPQLWNVLRGDMALFGPRPLPVDEAKHLFSWQKKRQVIKPGILSPWVLDGYHRRTFDEWMRDDCQYVQKKNFCYDVGLFFRSVLFMTKLLFREIVRSE